MSVDDANKVTAPAQPAPAASRRSPKTNHRSLLEIAADLHKVERSRIFESGELLLEAKAGHPKEFLKWLAEEEFDYSHKTAERRMAVVRLGQRFDKLSNLKVAVTTLYALTDLENYLKDEELKPIIARLTKESKSRRLKAAEGKRLIRIEQGRLKYGHHPDATLNALIDEFWSEPGGEDVIEALLAANPETDEAAEKIVDEAFEAKKARDAIEAREERLGPVATKVDDEPTEADTAEKPTEAEEPTEISNVTSLAEARRKIKLDQAQRNEILNKLPPKAELGETNDPLGDAIESLDSASQLIGALAVFDRCEEAREQAEAFGDKWIARKDADQLQYLTGWMLHERKAWVVMLNRVLIAQQSDTVITLEDGTEEGTKTTVAEIIRELATEDKRPVMKGKPTLSVVEEK
jgi:hypothetical protein